MEINGCVALVTGGASGLGEACVSELIKNGGKVSIFDMDQERGEKIAHELGDEVIFCLADVTDDKSVQAAIDRTYESFGTIQVVINCAGIVAPAKVFSKKGPMAMDSFNKVVHINLMGTINVIRLAIEKMINNPPDEQGERGVIINTSSMAAFEGQIGQAAYSASKGGVLAMTLPLAREFADYGIRVMCISPGIFDTPMMAKLSNEVNESVRKMIPFPKRFGKSSEFALLVKHIIENPYLNGETIRLDGACRMGAK